MTKINTVPTSPEAEMCRQALANAMRPYADKLGPQGMLAVASAFVGQLIALQDQRTTTPAMAREIIVRNIEGANQEVVNGLRDSTAGRA
jgi:hypothetical protein